MAPPNRPRPVDASMTLLTEVIKRPLDAGYAEAAQRKAAQTQPGPRWAGLPVLVVALVLGLAVAWGVRALRSPEPADLQARAVLETNAQEAYAKVEALTQTAKELGAEVRDLRQAALGQQDPAAARQAQALAAVSGAVAVTGPGLTVTLQAANDEAGADADPE
ncbi:MAG: hypothetical protein LBR19_04775, partial [Bifidobacteriaceae bacterium]|nr:hypothetical protein [Bifidobacteriaceae bacterium]